MKDRPRVVRFKLHIDHIDNEDKDVWAVSYGKKYITAHSLIIVQMSCEGVPVRKRQPRAFLTGYGVVRVIEHRSGRRTIYIQGQ
jgi:hypothetical protein